MTSSPFSQPRIEGVGPLAHQVLDWTLTQTLHCLIGVAIGAVAARAMRHKRIHWSWACVALTVVLLARPGMAGAASTLAVASVSAAATTRRWHREEEEAGMDLAAVARGRRSPLQLILSGAGDLVTRCQESFGKLGWTRDGELALGRDELGRTVWVPLSDRGGIHTLVVGATGSGKTITQTWIAVQAIASGTAAIVIDPKGDVDMRRDIRRAALEAGRPFLEWSPRGGSIYNPYLRGTDTEIADKLLAGERFTEPHYLRQAQRYLGHVVRVLRAGGARVSLRSVVDHLDPMNLEVFARTLPGDLAESTHAYIDTLTTRQHNELGGVRDRLAILAESDVGPWLDPDTPNAPVFELLDAVRARSVVYFSLEADSRPLLTQMLGAAIVQDLVTTVAALQGDPTPTLVCIDEFSAIAANQVVRLFGRARSAGFSLLLGTQELSDLRPHGGERLLEQVMGNLSLLIAHRQVVPGSAELISSVAGARGAWKVSRHSNGRSTRTRTRERVLDPDEVMRLAPGWAAVIGLATGGGVRIANVFSPAFAATQRRHHGR